MDDKGTSYTLRFDHKIRDLGQGGEESGEREKKLGFGGMRHPCKGARL